MRAKSTTNTIYGRLHSITLTPWEMRVLQEAIAIASINKTTEQIVISGTCALRENVGAVMRDFCRLAP